VTPVLLLLILVAYVFQPEGKVNGENKEWTAYVNALVKGESAPPWEWSGNGMIGKLLHKDLENRRRGIEANASVSPDEKKKQLDFVDQLKTWRNIDRLAMIGAYTFFGGLVWFAWSRRRAEGRV
jgi:hypothetical protein